MSWKYAGEFAFLPAPDPLWRHTPTPLERCYNVLGITLTVSTNAPILADLAEEVFGAWGEPEPGTEKPTVRLKVVLHDVEEPVGCVSPSVCRAHEGTLLLNRGASIGFGDRPTGTAAAFITPRMLRDPETVRSNFLECLGLFIVCRYRRATLHAAAVVHNDRCVLLTGENGAGKSTLAYACLRAGFRFIADDIVFIEEQGAEVRAWGIPWNLHLLSDSVRFFPELNKMIAVARMNGERKLRLDVKKARPDAPITQSPVWGVCSLSRSAEGRTRLADANPDCVRRALTGFKEDPMLDCAAMEAAADRLLEGRTAHLEVCENPISGVETLRRWMEAG